MPAIGSGPPRRIGDWRLVDDRERFFKWQRDTGYGGIAIVKAERAVGGWIAHARETPTYESGTDAETIVPSNAPVSNKEDARMLVRQWLRDNPSWPDGAAMSGFGIGL